MDILICQKEVNGMSRRSGAGAGGRGGGARAGRGEGGGAKKRFANKQVC